MHKIFQEGTTGVWFDIANNEQVPCGTSKRIYLENGGLHVTDSGQDVTITFTISRKKLIGLGLTLIFAACLDLRGILFRNVLSKALRTGRPQPGQGHIEDGKDITAVECAGPSFAEAENIAPDYRYVRTRFGHATTPGYSARRTSASRARRMLQE